MRSVVDFLSALASNNNREWFAAHKAEYRQAEAQFGEFALGVIDGIAAFDDSVRGLGLRDCTYRIYRDTRFSADKTPYKTNMGVFVAPHGKKAGYAGYYLHIEPSAESFLWAGSHMPSPVVLRSIREEIIDNGEAIERAIAGSHGFELCRDRSLQRNPKGFPTGNRYDEWLRLLDFGIMKPLDERTILAPDLLVRVLDDFRSTAPLVAILNRAVRYAYEEMM